MSEEVKREDWAGFCNEFSKRNQARLTRLEIFGEMGAQEEERSLPLNGISLAEGGTKLEILLGGAAINDPRHLTHTIEHVTNVYAKTAADGQDEALEIVDAAGTKTLLRFESRA
ncbi:MAG: DUF5335 family protein [Acidobacteria bacterium]|nr:DUF5335 family protein [Acidobacteriota bacterium]MBI3424997.1 DUF5335 family protein [Acidobacteriota bacterium]